VDCACTIQYRERIPYFDGASRRQLPSCDDVTSNPPSVLACRITRAHDTHNYDQKPRPGGRLRGCLQCWNLETWTHECTVYIPNISWKEQSALHIAQGERHTRLLLHLWLTRSCTPTLPT
jgi:hypothetical protein